ncbi:Capsular polysaccharide biosynthesis protein [Kurthia zopfii]|nr:Capsular polysaccharide biosynthesis protein [Kurthia zopfii]
MRERSYLITLKDFGRIFFRNKYKILLVGIIGLLIGLYISQFSKNEYVAQAEILIDTKNGNANDSTLQMMPTYKDLLLSKVTLESVKKKLDYEIGSKELRKMLDVKIAESSQVLTIFVNTEDEKESISLTNLYSEILKQEVQKHFKNTNVKILNSASITSETDKDIIVLMFSLIGFILFALSMYAVVLAKEVYFPKIDSIKKIEMLGQTALAKISNNKKMNIEKNDFQLLASLLQKKLIIIQK